ncbi:S8 family serine peptidase [Candidatus Sumerlaeota bacterium]
MNRLSRGRLGSHVIIIVLVAAGLLWPGVASAQQAFVPGEIIVKYKRPTTLEPAAAGRGAQAQGVTHTSASLAELDRRFGLVTAQHPRERVGAAGAKGAKAPAAKSNQSIPSTAPRAAAWRVLSFSSGADAKAIAAAYAQDPGVAFAEPNYIGTLGYTPTDPAYDGRQSSLYDRLHLEEAWDIQQGDPAIIVAVIDSGVDLLHPDLVDAITSGGWNYVDGNADIVDDLGHGTRVAGIIAAAENGAGGVGAAFGCSILPFDVADSRAQVRVADVAAAIEDAAAQGAHVINLSLSFRHSSQLLQEAVDVAAETAVVVAAVGNDGQGDSPRYPASCEGALGVGAINADGGCAIFSNFNGRYGKLIDLVAPGVKVYSTTPGGGWSGGAEASGTSFAAPFVSAAAALLRAQHPEQSPASIARHLEKTAGRQSTFREWGAFWRYSHKRKKWGMGSYFGHDNEQGSGLVNPLAALSTPMIPTLSVLSVAVVDDPLYSAVNDGDGELDQGETVRLRVELACADNDAFELATVLTTADPRIAFMDGATTVTELDVSLKALRSGRTARLTFANVYVDPAAGRGDVLFVLACSDRDGLLPDLSFDVRIENKVQVSGPQPDVHFTNDYAYIVEDDLTLSGVCLIDPGTPFTVYPQKTIRLLTGGSLTAVGNNADPITFTSLYKIPDLSLLPPTPDRPIAGLSDPHNVGPKTEPVDLANYQQVRYVSADTGSNTTGTGIVSSPWQSIQYALDQIDDASTGNKYALLVAEGSYTGTASSVVAMKEWVDLWGGFEATGWARDIAMHVSTIDGENAWRCVTGVSDARLDGFTITRGNGSNGGGIECTSDGSLTISNNIISENLASNFGAGIWCPNARTIRNNVISGNVARIGGGIFIFGSSPTISSNVITGNSATFGDGGGIQLAGSFAIVSDNVISGNSANFNGGGIFCHSGSSPAISNNVISANSVTRHGGGIFCEDGSPVISNNVISANSASNYGGGIICQTGASPTISNNVISGNSASGGGGIGCGGSGTSPTISNNVISGNSASSLGGGISCWDASPTILNSVVRDNTAGTGGQVYTDGTGPPVVSYSNISEIWSGSGENNVDLDPQFVGVIASGAATDIVFDATTSQTTVALSGIDSADRDLTGWVIQIGPDLGASTGCSYAAIASYTTTTLVLWGDATKAVDGSIIAAPTNWQIFDYRLRDDSPMKGLGLGPDDQTTTFSTLVSRFDGDGQPRYGAKCEIGPDEIEWDTDFPDSVWGVFEIEVGATVDFAHVSFENGSGVRLDGAAAGGAIADCQFFQHYGAGLDASTGTLTSVARTSATANWGRGLVAPNASLSDALAARNRDTGLTAASATDSQSDANWGHGFDLTGAAENLTADDNTTDGIRAASALNSMARSNGGWGVVGDATDVDAQNNGAGGIRGSATGSRAIGNGDPGIQDGAHAMRCEVRDNASTGVLSVALVEDSTISGNGGAGIVGATQVTNSSVSDSAGAGAIGGTFFDTTLEGNRGPGALSPTLLSHCTVSRNTGDGITGSNGTATVNNTLVSDNEGAGLVNLGSVKDSNILGNLGFAAIDNIALGGGARDFAGLTGNYWGALDTDELFSAAEDANVTFLNDTLDGSGAWRLDVWPFASATVPEAPRAGGPPWAWRVRPDMSSVTTLGATTFTLTYTSSMDTSVDPSVTFGLESPYQLRIVEPAPGWLNPTTWQGAHTIGTNTGDGINTIRISGAMAADGFPIPDDTSHRFYLNTRDPFVANNGLALALGSSSMRCSWDARPGGGAARFNLLMSAGDLDHFQKANPALIEDTEHTVDSLTPETLYFFRTQYVEADGTTEDWTSIFYGWTPAVVAPTTITMTLDALALDVATQQPIAGALVTLVAETTGQDTTDANGQAGVSVLALPSTAYTATVTHADYQTATRQYTTAAAVSDEFLLTANPPTLFSTTIHGYALDAATSQPVAGAVIVAQSESTTETLSSLDGSYTLEVSSIVGGFVSMSAEATSGGLSASAFLPAVDGSQQVDFSMVGGLSFDAVADVFAQELETVVIPLTLSGDAGATITLSSRGLPSGAVLDQETMRLEWPTQLGDAGVYNPTIYADASDGRRGQVEFQLTITREEIPPTAVISLTDSNPTNGDTVNFAVSFSESVGTSFDESDIVASGALAAGALIGVTGGPQNYVVAATPVDPNADGTLGIEIQSPGVTDLAGNVFAGGLSALYTIDNTVPAVSIGSPSVLLTRGGPVSYGLNFSLATSVATNADILSSATLNRTGAADGVLAVTGSGNSTRTVTISSITGDGALSITITSGTAVNSIGVLAASAGPSAAVSVDNTPPAVPAWLGLSPADDTGFSSGDGVTTKSAGLHITGVADAESTVTLYVDSIAATSGTAAVFNSSGLTLSLVEGTTTVTATAIDAAGNVSGISTGTVVTVDTTRPSVSVNQSAGQLDPSGVAPLNFTAVFSEVVHGFDSSAVTVGGTAGGPRSVSVTTADMITHTIAVGNITSAGTVSVSVAAGKCADLAGNPNLASTSTDNSVIYDTTPPQPAGVRCWMLFE